MLTPTLIAVLTAAPSFTLADSVPGGMNVELLDDGRWLYLERRWAGGATAAEAVLELDLYGLAEKKALTLKVPMKPLHGRAGQLFVDGTDLHPRRGAAIAPYELELLDYRPAANEASFLVKNTRIANDKTWKRRWIWAVLGAEDGEVIRAHVLHEEAGPEDERFAFRLELRALEPGGAAGWFSLRLEKPDRSVDLTVARVDLATGATTWSQTLELPPSNNKNRGGFHFAATDDFSALVFAEYSEAAYEPIEPRPAAYVVWPKTGRVQQLAIPYTPYGLAFDAKGETLVLGSNQARKLVSYRLSDGKVMKELPTGEHLHRVHLLPGGTHALVLYNGPKLEVRAWPALQPVTSITAKSLQLQGFCGGGSHRSADGRTFALPRCDARGLTTNDGAIVLQVK